MSEHKGSDLIETKKVERLLENLSNLEDRSSGLRNRVHSADERLNGSDDEKIEGQSEEAVYGSIDQALNKVARIDGIINDCHAIMGKIEASV